MKKLIYVLAIVALLSGCDPNYIGGPGILRVINQSNSSPYAYSVNVTVDGTDYGVLGPGSMDISLSHGWHEVTTAKSGMQSAEWVAIQSGETVKLKF